MGKQYIFLLGGLGNQMFQYAFYFAKKNAHQNVSYLCDYCNFYNPHNGYELDRVFGIKCNRNIFHFYLCRFLMKIELTSLSLKYIPFLKLIKQKGVGYDTRYINKTDGLSYYYGFWQSDKYFLNLRNLLLDIFRFDESKLNEKSKNNLVFIRKVNSVSVHIRRGDYLEAPYKNLYDGICNKEYYERALTLIKQRYPDACFFFFSNDMEWVRQQFKIENAIFIEHNYGNQSWQDMYLMSECKHNIIANSTFSWWGAWLNKNANKMVISPKHFINIEIDCDIVPESWIKL